MRRRTIELLLLAFSCVALAGGCSDGDDSGSPGGQDSRASADPGSLAEIGEADASADVLDESDEGGLEPEILTSDTVDDTVGPDDLGTSEVSPDGGGTPGIPECGSLFASRILERQMAEVPGFSLDCDAPLTSDIGELSPGGEAICVLGESANQCRERLYDTPPALGTLNPGCWTPGGPMSGCLLGKFLPKCADGSDDGCAEPEVVCQDGTRPMVYAEPAVSGSNDWIFFLGGEGGPCAGGGCWVNYRYGGQQAKAAFSKAMSSTHPDFPTAASIQGSGLMYGAVGPPTSPLAGTNRVKWKRCSDAASDGVQIVNVAATDTPTDPSSAEVWATAPVWHKGLDIWLGLFRSLTTPEGRDLNGDGVPDLPSLADAETVLLAGSSDASLWVVHSADRLRAELQDIAGVKVDVRVLVDGYYQPMLDNEGRYAAAAPTDFSLLSHPYTAGDSCTLPDDGKASTGDTCSNLGYVEANYPDGSYTVRGAMAARSSRLDESCEAYHGAGAAPCYDRQYVLVHHLQTPVMVVADQEDSVISGARIAYSDDLNYRWSGLAPFRQRVLDQTYDILEHWTTAARKDGPGTPGDLALILRKSRRDGQPAGAANHTHFGDSTKMAWKMTQCTAGGEALQTLTIAAAINSWAQGTLPVELIAEDASSWDGLSAYWVTGSTCIPAE